MKGNRNEMIVGHLPLVAFVVNRMPSEGAGAVGIDRDDATGYGIEGLIHAVDAYSLSSVFAARSSTRCESRTLCRVRCEETPSRSSTHRRNWPRSWGAGPRRRRSRSSWAFPYRGSITFSAGRAHGLFRWSILWKTAPATAASMPGTRSTMICCLTRRAPLSDGPQSLICPARWAPCATGTRRFCVFATRNVSRSTR